MTIAKANTTTGKKLRTAGRLLRSVLPIAILAAVVAGCDDPLSVDTPRRIIPVNIDSILLSEPFLSKYRDTLFAQVDGKPVAFNSELLRPVFYNREVSGLWYLSVQGARYDLKGDEYTSLSLRLDGIGDTGTFPMKDAYSIPKKVDPAAPSKYAGRYEERTSSATLSYTTDQSVANGAVRVVGIDLSRRVIVGTFSFAAYDADAGKTVRIESGIFRLRLDVQ